MRSLSAVLALIRWPNALLAAAGVALGAWWAGGDVMARDVVITMLVALALTAVANAENDYQDRALDRIAHPERPLPSGALRPSAARGVAVVAAVIAVVLSAAVSTALGVVSAAVVGVMVAYTPLLRQSGLLGNVVVGIVASLPFAYGAFAVGAPRSALPLVAVAIPMHVAREIAKDIEDAAADRSTRRTVPVARGARAARAVLLAALVAGSLSLIPFVVDRPWLAAFIVPAVLAATLGTRRVLRGRRGAPTLYKIAMACAMISLVLAHWR